MSYIESSKIKVFPAAGRSTEYPEGYLTTEDNLNRVVNAIYASNNSSFVISSTADSEPFKFVIKGYYFEITDLTGLDVSGDLYATIYLLKTLPDGSYVRLVSPDYLTESSLDSTGDFKGVTFSTSKPVSSDSVSDIDTYTLQLLKGGSVPETSKFRYKTSEVLDGETGNLISASFTTENLSVTGSATISSATITSATISSTATITEATITEAEITEAKVTNLELSTVSLDGTLTGGTLKNNTITGTTSLTGTLKTSAGNITPSNLMTDAELSLSADSRTLIITLTNTHGKNNS